MSTTIRVSEETRNRFAALARQTGRPMTQVLDQAAEALERDLFFIGLEHRWDELRQDDGAWLGIEAERKLEERSLSDGSE